ncbi:hypothetical protein SORDD17_00963 [Streptococcus oralis]|uniref:DUF2992 domain-containing protein n=1 Tax=Streptococcus oralis TaxID=1303 RepID=A0A139RLJ8_STROR|nr:YjdF family protein [Streptococcus oralis]KXU15637.1 hypothetical protein SORDD17_00963 [Streptococcus oralis]
MEKVSMTLTVYFDGGFWYGLFEREQAQAYAVCRVPFGAEPSNQEVLDFLHQHYHQLRFSPSIKAKSKVRPINPKRLQRQAKKEQAARPSTKSQEAVKLQCEEQKQAAKSRRRQQKERVKQRKFERKQQKRLEKHKGH